MDPARTLPLPTLRPLLAQHDAWLGGDVTCQVFIVEDLHRRLPTHDRRPARPLPARKSGPTPPRGIG
jgi:hypothetical protein